MREKRAVVFADDDSFFGQQVVGRIFDLSRFNTVPYKLFTKAIKIA